jgi:nicotinate-nucleotide adenylyltransferase
VDRVSVALFGGSFNPPHVGHVLAVAYALSAEMVERVVVVPVFEHAFGKQLEAYEHRVEMARRAFAWLPRVEVSTIESRLGAPSLTLRTILALEAEHPDWALRLPVGSDILGEIQKWHAFSQIEQRAPLLVLPRAGATAVRGKPSVLPQVSSSEVRGMLAALAPEATAPEALSALLPKAVLAYVREHQLYRAQ